MRLIEFADNYTWGSGESTCVTPNNARTWFTASTRSDRGYGPGIWLYAIRDSSDVWYVLDGTYCAIQGQNVTNSNYDWTNYGFNAAGTAPLYTAKKAPGEISIVDTTKRTYLMSMALSDAYGARVPLWNPTFRIYELLDAGDFTFQFYCVQDGYEDDAHLKFKGRNISSATSGGLAYLHAGSKLVHYKSDGTSTVIQEGKNCTSGTMYTFTLDVKSGDRIELQCQSGYSAYSLTYCNIRVSANIPGWKVEGT